MTPVYCQITHNPPETYGDCLRACVATVLDLQSHEVPHFYNDGCSGEVGTQRLRDWLKSRRQTPFFVGFDASMSVNDVIECNGIANPGAVYLLFGATKNGDHVVVCQDGEIVHDPSVHPLPITKSSGPNWLVMVIAAS